MTKVAIIGGGASGFFTAIHVAQQVKAEVTLYEGQSKLLSKVLISGGGRCNVTNAISEPNELVTYYPRGNAFLLDPFTQFSSNHTQQWFKQHGVPLKTEADGRVFPVSDKSQSIYNCLTQTADRLGIKVKTEHRLTGLIENPKGYELVFKDKTIRADVVVMATSCNKQVFSILRSLSISLIDPVPSLFTFNAQDHMLKLLSGISVPSAKVSINEIKSSEQEGPVLVTHWGYSGPAILRLSAWSARELHDLDYNFTLSVNWLNQNLKDLVVLLKSHAEIHPKDKVINWKEHGLPKRLWNELFRLSNLKEYTNWSEIGKKGIQRLATQLTAFQVKISGKSTFKEEFVTAGGIDLDTVSAETFEIRGKKNLYAVGELLNIDAITGGFNFQAAWTGGYLAAKSIVKNIKNQIK